MTKEKKIICVLAGIILGILLTTAFVGNYSSAHSQNVKTAGKRLIERFPETHIYPSVGLGIFIGESGGGHNNGRYYGVMAGRRYDITESTDQFIELIRYSGWYGSAYKAQSWRGQLSIIQSHGYCQDGTDYERYIESIIEREGFEEFDRKAIRYKKKLKRKQRELKRKRQQSKPFTLIYNPALAPWQVITYQGVIKGGTIRIQSDHLYGWCWLDVIKTKKGSRNVIYTGDREAILHPVVTLQEVIENAKG